LPAAVEPRDWCATLSSDSSADFLPAIVSNSASDWKEAETASARPAVTPDGPAKPPIYNRRENLGGPIAVMGIAANPSGAFQAGEFLLAKEG
jgi:hypothetical protein